MNKREVANAIIQALLEHNALDPHISSIDSKPLMSVDGTLHINLYNANDNVGHPGFERCTITLRFYRDTEEGYILDESIPGKPA